MSSSKETALTLSEEDINDINIISRFLAISDKEPSASASDSAGSLNENEGEVEVYVLIGNAILETITTTLNHLQSTCSFDDQKKKKKEKRVILVLCGGIGHSTSLLWESVKYHHIYKDIYEEIVNLPEARVMELILYTYHRDLLDKVEVLIEDKSTNCGLNASYTKDTIEDYLSSSSCSISIRDKGEEISKIRMIIIQDPTMSLRTLASFQHVFKPSSSSTSSSASSAIGILTLNSTQEIKVEMEIWSIFIPLIKSISISPTTQDKDNDSKIVWEDGDGRDSKDLWTIDRFLELIMGEIPRLRDDVHGYGPEGKGFIEHVDLTTDVEQAFDRLEKVLIHRR